jgi:uncharacterized protein
MYYILFYKTIDNYIEKRKPFRTLHLQMAKAAYENGTLIMAGALDEPADEAVFVFKTDNPETVMNFAKNDPYVQNNLISKWFVRPWNVVIGN